LSVLTDGHSPATNSYVPTISEASTAPQPLWAKVIDQTRCIGCHACTTACKSENEVPLSVTRTYVKSVDVGRHPRARRAFQVTRCNQCEDAPCVAACPTAAMYSREDGIVDFDKSACIGCKACIAACPYDAIFINPDDHSAEKCNFCAHRLDIGLEPACVVVCPTEALIVGDMNDPLSEVAGIVHQEPVAVRRPEKETRPKVFYKGADRATLDPLAARQPEGGLFMWSEQDNGHGKVSSGHTGPRNSSAAALLSYDVPHEIPWDFRVSLYTFTKSIAAGAYLVPLLLAVAGMIPWSSPVWTLVGPLVALAFLVLTGTLLVWDLEHPERFWMVLARPQWRSWLVRGGFAITAYGALLAAHIAAVVAGRPEWTLTLAWAGGPLAVATAVYTAYLLAQARARDLWQSPLLPPHFLVQALLAGSGALMLADLATGGALALGVGAAWIFQASLAVHVALALGEATMTHPTAHAALAARGMLRGRYAGPYWTGFFFAAAALALVAMGVHIGVAAGLAALLLYEHAYLQAGQSVPLS